MSRTAPGSAGAWLAQLALPALLAQRPRQTLAAAIATTACDAAACDAATAPGHQPAYGRGRTAGGGCPASVQQ